ncbi:hypothetical protein [Novosphingobium sp. M1R2S20]|uniref:Uncharacterized protein n=1 Tax=Novosphingobium rhizovicinum TaxID=3228928 RepID=A0ABV3R6S6_9SPHN
MAIAYGSVNPILTRRALAERMEQARLFFLLCKVAVVIGVLAMIGAVVAGEAQANHSIEIRTIFGLGALFSYVGALALSFAPGVREKHEQLKALEEDDASDR